MHTLDYELLPSERHVKPCKHFEYPSQTYYQEKQIASGFIEHWNIMLLCQNHGKSRLTSLEYSILCRLPIQASLLTSYMILNLRHGPNVSGAFCILKFFYTDTPSVHTCPPYTLGVSRDFCIRSPEWKFLNTLCIRIHVDTCIRIFLYTLTSQYQNQSFSARDLLTNPLRCPDTNRISVDSRIQFYYATCGRRYFCICIKKFADTKISRYVWTGPYCTYYVTMGSCRGTFCIQTHCLKHSTFVACTSFTTWTIYRKCGC